MPQMAPLNWLTLTLYFIMLLMSLTILNFYVMMPIKSPTKLEKIYLKFNWKW